MASNVPYTGVPTVQPSFDATPSMSSNIPMDAFGAGVAGAVGHLGKSIEGAGSELYSRAIAMQQLNEQANAANAVAEFTTAQGEKYAQYSTQSGKNAVDGYKPYIDDLNATRESIGQKLSSPYAQKLYLQESRSIQARSVFSAAAHAGREGKNYAIGSTQSLIDARQNAAALAPQDDESYQASLAQNARDARQLGVLEGKDDQWVKNYTQQMNSKMTMGRIQGLAKSDVPSAQKLLDAAVKAGNITGEDLGRAQSYIRTQKLSVASRQEASRMFTGDNPSIGQGKAPVENILEAIAGNEGADYGMIHPTKVTHKVKGQMITEQALGRYGVMQSNLQDWLKEAGMPAMTEQEFLNNPKAQDKLAGFKLGQYQDEGGSAIAAANRWFTGSYTPDPKKTDGISTAAGYQKKFLAGLAKNSGAAEISTAARARSKQLFGDDAEAEDAMEQQALIRHSRDKSMAREAEYEARQTIEDALVPAKDGKLVTSIEDVQDPKVQAAWDQLKPSQQNRYRRLMAQNAKGDYEATQENQLQYRSWLGKLTDPMASPEEKREAMNTDFATMAMPAAQRQQLNMLRAKLWKDQNKNPALNHAMSISDDILRNAGITRSKNKDDYDQIRGSMFLILNDRMNAGDPVKKDEEIRQISSRLVREVSNGKWFGILPSKEQAFKVQVPEKEKQYIIDKYTADTGSAPTEKDIQSIYNAKMYNQLYGKAKKQASDAAAAMTPTVPRSQ
jgi:hypothetical protein